MDLNIGIAQLNTIIADVQGNLEKAKKTICKLHESNADIIVFSEMYITGYPPKDLIWRKDLIDDNVKAANEIIEYSKEFPETAIVFGYIEPNPTDGQKDHFNTIITVKNGEVINKRRKTLLPTYDVFHEARYFQPGDLKEEFIPFVHKGIKIGIINCEESWNDLTFWKDHLYSVDPVAETVRNGAEYIIVCNASPFRIGIEKTREKMMQSHCKRHNVGCAYINQTGYNDDVGFDGCSFLMTRGGDVIYRSPAFEEDTIVINTSQTIRAKDNTPWQLKTISALKCGIRDYFNKLNISGPAIIGLSGGIDSALVAFLATSALGRHRVIAVGMPSEFSSEHSRTDAEKLAEKLGIYFAMEPIKNVHNEIRTSVDNIKSSIWSDAVSWVGANGFAGVFNREKNINTKDSGVTDENIQARIRGIYLMALSNYYSGIVLSTGNKSEMAVGYCTIYGDMCGGLSVISDLFKTKVFEVCRWINEQAGDEIIPWNTMNKPPSAELRENQTDQQSLPPYDTLDAILTKFVEEEKTVEQIIKEIATEKEIKDYEEKVGRQLVRDIVWVCQAVMRNEFKRKQAPTGLKLTNRMFKYGWDMPIVHKMFIGDFNMNGVKSTFEK